MVATAPSKERQGPLAGLRVVEFHSLGPGPFAGMLLADIGADVLRITRTAQGEPEAFDRITSRGRRVVSLDLKRERETALALCGGADVLIEGYRPGVMERLGLGPEQVHARNPGLIYGRMTGWGQEGPLARTAGHDINYIALTGALAAIGRRDMGPVPPLNLVGDYGGGALYLVMGVLAALWERARSGAGQVIDSAMCDGAASLMSMFYDMRAGGTWSLTRESNLLDGGAPFYGTYECADGGHIAVGALEPQFWQELCTLAGLDTLDPALRDDPARWPDLRTKLADIFRQRTRAEWCARLELHDTCVSPVLHMDEAPQHPHMVARGTFIEVAGLTQPSPAPRFSRTPPAEPSPPQIETAQDALRRWGL